VAALVAAASPASATVYTYDKLAYLTFSGPVQIPGATLAAGTYRFRLTNPSTSRNVLQVLSRDGDTVYAMFHTIPDSRPTVTSEPTVTFLETPVDVPPPVRTLFYGGEYHGYEFVYPKGGPDMTAPEWPQPEITYMPAPAAPIVEEEEFVEPEEEFVQEPPAPAPVQEPVELPRTASPLPLVTFGGGASVVAGLLLALLRRRGA
jgi:hypothetical protein